MALSSNDRSQTRGLRKDALSIREVIFQGVAAAAPAGAAVATMTGAAAFALGSLPLTAVVAFIVVALNAYIINRLSTHVAGAGGYYDYVKLGFGKHVSAYTGWSYIIYQVTSLAFIGLSISVFVPALLSNVFNINLPSWAWLPMLAGTVVFGYAVSVMGVKGSLQYASVMATLEIAVVVLIGMWLIFQHPSINTASVFTPKYASGGFGGVLLGVLFMYTAFSGFGTSTPLGEETKGARKTIARGIILTMLILGAFFIFAAYSFTVGWGVTNMGNYANALVPGISLAYSNIGLWAAILITVFYVNSILTDMVTFTNSSSRVLYAMAKDGFFPSSVSKVHATRLTPHVAAAIMAVASFFVAAASTVLMGGFNAFLFTGVAGTLGSLLVHMMANASLPKILHDSAKKVGLINMTLTAVSLVVLGFVFYGSFISVSQPVLVAAYLFVAWMIAGLVYVEARFRRGMPSAKVVPEE
ncbi:MAG TPA: APC family permease [Thermoplasmataceae archaeon]|nr:APC family permease [Thermoplasmatales archaeon AK]HLH86250.1 APC family permease [Thermoplasmataceae archaeon]